MNRTSYRPIVGVLLAGLLLSCGADAAAASAIAKVTQLEGQAWAYGEGVPMRSLAEDDEVSRMAKIITGKNATLTLEFTDGTQLVLGAKTSIRLDQYDFQPRQAAADDDGLFSFSTSILSGVVRTVTGAIAKARPRSVRFKTTVATIGIRGTHFTAEVQDTSATVILLAQENGSPNNAIEVSNQFGKVEIDEAGYGTEIPDATSPPSPPRKMTMSSTMNRILRSSQTIRRVIVPRSPMH